MLLSFSVENFSSIKEKQTLSFIANKSDHLENAYVIKKKGIRILKMIMIYGANASGKSNILKALDFLKTIVIHPKNKKDEKLEYEPFLFDNKTIDKPTKFSIEFIINDIRYFYEVSFNKLYILNETLYFYDPNKALVFERKTNLKKELSEIEFGSKIKIDNTTKERLETNLLTNNTVLGTFLKTNVEIKEIKEVVEWFNNNLKPLIHPEFELKHQIVEIIEKDELLKKYVILILKKADFQISDIIIKRKSFKDIYEQILSYINYKNRFSLEEFIENGGYEKGVHKPLEIKFIHSVKKEKFDLAYELESEGTKRFFELAGLLALSIKNSTIFPIDELESSLHPDLFRQFILMFLMNTKNSQIIATTHNREILKEKDLFREDTIWFTEKDENASTQLYSLADFHSSVVRDTSNVFNAYKIGKLGAIPNLGDYYID
jgi:AAA15 family ATPase/GTPase